MSVVTKEAYLKTLKVCNINAVSPREVAEDYEECCSEWYHLLMNEQDFFLLTAVSQIKWYTICRCHLVADDGSTAHEHMHALVHFKDGLTLLAYRKRLQRIKERLNIKTTFRKIFCLDHAVGVLRYICCEDGQKPTRRDNDGLLGSSHSHYERKVFSPEWLHKRSKICVNVRDEISTLCSEGVTDIGLYKSEFELHNAEECRCERGVEGVKKREEANKKRRQFYSTERGLLIKKKYQQRKQEKDRLIRTLMEMQLKNKAEMQRDTISKLILLL